MSSEEIIYIGDFEIHLVKNLRAKHVLLKQNTKGEIVLTCPRFCTKGRAIRFAETQLPWIKAHLQHAPKEIIFCPEMSVSLLGKSYCLKSGKRTEVIDGVLFISGESSFFHRRVCSYAQKILLPYIQNKAQQFAQELEVHVGRITLRNTSSRWGSCSSTKNLSFCWKIAFAPLNVIDYLVAHEVAHLAHMNHSPHFWATVDSLIDKRKEAEHWLKTNGRQLQRIR